jgi:P-type E1-E2 ATPase
MAAAILKRCKDDEIFISSPEDTEVRAGRGVLSKIAGKAVIVGNERLFMENGIKLTPEAIQFVNEMTGSGSAGVLVGHDSRIIGGIGIADILRKDVKGSIKEIKKLGIKKVIMLTGDNKKVAQAISEGAGLDEIVADLLPEDKLEHIKKLKQQGDKVAMVGDGINDAPSLIEADVGIAMGVIGTDAAIEAADIALTTDDISKVSESIALSRKTVSIIKESLFISVAINGIALILASTGDIGPVLGAIIHNIGSLVVVGNSSRLIGYRFKK